MLISLKSYFWCVFSEGRACKARAIQMNLFNFPRLRRSRYLDRHWTPPETRVTWQSKQQLLRTLIAFVLAYMAIEMALLEEELDQPLLSCFRLEKNDFLCGRLLFAVQANPLPTRKSHESHTKVTRRGTASKRTERLNTSQKPAIMSRVCDCADSFSFGAFECADFINSFWYLR